MVVLNYISVTSTATPISQDSPTPSVPDPRQTKVILPKKKPLKWSTGVAPGDYAGPPTTTKLRKYWRGEEEDPLDQISLKLILVRHVYGFGFNLVVL